MKNEPYNSYDLMDMLLNVHSLGYIYTFNDESITIGQFITKLMQDNALIEATRIINGVDDDSFKKENPNINDIEDEFPDDDSDFEYTPI